jgi:hypothetical protein
MKELDCSFCFKHIGMTEKKYNFGPQGTYCLDCMTCSVCGSKATGEPRNLVGLQPFCRTHYLEVHNEETRSSLPLNKWPRNFLEARVKCLTIKRAHLQERMQKDDAKDLIQHKGTMQVADIQLNQINQILAGEPVTVALPHNVQPGFLFLDKDEEVQWKTGAVFYGQTTVLSSWGSALGTGFGGVGLASSTARQEEKFQARGLLCLTNKRLAFVKDFQKAPLLIFSVPLDQIQSVTQRTKMFGSLHGVGVSYVTGQGVQTASFVVRDVSEPEARNWVTILTNAVQSSRNLPQSSRSIPQHTSSDQKPSDQKYCSECGKQIPRTAKFCPECGATLSS